MNSRIQLDAATVKAQIAALLHNYPELTDDAEALSLSLESETDLEQIMSKLVRLERGASSYVKALDNEMELLEQRQTRYVRHMGAYRAMMQSIMETAAQTKLTLPIATVSIVRGRPGCVITDETLLPDVFMRIRREPEKAKITAALMAGDVPGAELRNSQPHLMIRT